MNALWRCYVRKCMEKTANGNVYRSRKKANRVVMRMKEFQNEKALQAFHCPICKLYHVGKSDRKYPIDHEERLNGSKNP